MKTRFEPQDFMNILDSIFEQLKVVVRSQNYQELIISEYYANVDYTLVDAVQALEQASDAFVELDTVEAQQEFHGILPLKEPKE